MARPSRTCPILPCAIQLRTVWVDNPSSSAARETLNLPSLSPESWVLMCFLTYRLNREAFRHKFTSTHIIRNACIQ